VVIRIKSLNTPEGGEKIREALQNTSGVENVSICLERSEVSVTGTIEPQSVGEIIQQLGFELEQ